MKKWALYDELIDNIASDIIVEDLFISPHWVGVLSKKGLGLAMNMGLLISQKFIGNFKGMKLKDLACFSKSWDFHDASIGVAAINSFYNGYISHKDIVKKTIQNSQSVSIFDLVLDNIKGKKAAVIGHFPNIERLKDVCTLSILERKPNLLAGDLPDTACEYILEDQDYLFTTGVTLINKTLPRLLELTPNAKVFIVGPSTPLTNIMFKYSNIKCLAGAVAINEDETKNLFLEGASLKTVAKTKNLALITLEA